MYHIADKKVDIMLKIITDENNSQITRWNLDASTTWNDFHESIDKLKTQAQNTNKPFNIIATTTGQMPRGNALSHLRRLIKVIGDYDVIERFIIVNHKQNPIGQAFVGMALKLFASHNKLRIVSSEAEALELA